MRRRGLPDMTFAERVVAFVSPERAIKRALLRSSTPGASQSSRDGFYGARSGRRSMHRFKPGTGDANADTLPGLEDLRARSRDLVRNAPLAGGAVATTVTNVVGTGLRVRPRIDRELLGLDDDEADRWEEAAKRIWKLASGTAEIDYSRTQNFDAMQQLVFRSVLESGDLFCNMRFLERPGSPFGTKLQLIEADQVSNPRFRRDGVAVNQDGTGNRVAGGVEYVAETGAPVAYWLLEVHPGAGALGGATRKWTRLDAFGADTGRRNVLHVYDRMRVGQTRGLPYLAPVVELLKQLERYTDAEVWAAVINSCFAVAVKSTDGQGLNLPDGGQTKDDQEIVLTEPGMIYDLGRDETVESFTPGRPNSNFDMFVTSVVRQIGMALELPFEVLIKHFQSSYSAARAALLDAWRFFRKRRAWLAAEFCQPVYEAVLTEAVARELLTAPGFFEDPLIHQAYLEATWIGPSQGQIDPKREADADQAYLDMGADTLDDITARRSGEDWERVHKQRVKEKRKRREDGLESEAPANGLVVGETPPTDDEDDMSDAQQEV